MTWVVGDTVAKPLLQRASFAKLLRCAILCKTTAASITTGAVRALRTLGKGAAGTPRFVCMGWLVRILSADALVRAPEGKRIACPVLALLGHAGSATPITWHDFVSGIVPPKLVKVLLVHVLLPFLERSQHDVLWLSLAILMPAEWAPTYFIGRH